MKFILSALPAIILSFCPFTTGQGYTNESEVPYYGLSPPVYPTRKLIIYER